MFESPVTLKALIEHRTVEQPCRGQDRSFRTSRMPDARGGSNGRRLLRRLPEDPP